MQDTNGDEDPNIKEEDSNDNGCVSYKRARRPKELRDLPKMDGEGVSKL